MAISSKPRSSPVRLTRVLDRTGTFDVALSICSGVTFLGARSYLFVVKDPVRDAD
jgi:hypothetical protein